MPMLMPSTSSGCHGRRVDAPPVQIAPTLDSCAGAMASLLTVAEPAAAAAASDGSCPVLPSVVVAVLTGGGHGG
eukprot:806203-Pleurochrysis_carterae.AAC.2